MTVKPNLTYFHSVVKAPGVVAANEFLSVFNPVGSTRVAVAVGFTEESYASSSSTTTDPLTVYRTSAASGGTLIPASQVNRFDPAHPDPLCEVRVGGPTVTHSGLALLGMAPVLSTGQGANGNVVSPPPGASFIMYPGTGLTFGTASGNTNQIWNMQLIWVEAA